MKAVRIHGYGGADKLVVEDVDAPGVGPGQVKIENFYSSVNPIDWKLRSGSMKLIYPLKFPAILGFDFAGRVTAVGEGVSRFAVGDEVYCRSASKTGDAYAEEVVQDECFVAAKPAKMNYAEAAAAPLAALTALQALRDKGGLEPGGSVLINGASGGVGVYAVQIAKAMNARVTAVCSGANADLVRGLGADEVIDYKTADPLGGDETYDVVFDCVASLKFSAAKKKLKSGGVYVTTLPRPDIFLAKLFNAFSGKKGDFIVVESSGQDLEYLRGLVDDGKMISVIDSEFALADIVQAHERSEGGRVRGKIVVKIR